MQMKQESFQTLQQYTAQVESLYNSLRSFKHDYSNILLTLYEYIDTRDMDGLSSYFIQNILPLTKQLEPQNYHITRLANLHIVELKSMITAKIIYAQEMGIDVSIEIDQPIEQINTDIIDLVRMLGIFLDNAIEAALETDAPKLSFVIIKDEKETVFFITNSFIDYHLQLASLSQAGTSTKGSSRGIGLYNVAQIISHHDNLFLDTRTQDHTFMQILHIYA
ncbi:GHKL domain-containing protein [Coprococcus catus]|uniref:GHKL domain-containing protein n=1 Tax=Coprococcus catus TaxID=116085 RepID=A0A3E2T9T0_9FIRM|nr:GHKL domain-containing protein [Coprococcus catus]